MNRGVCASACIKVSIAVLTCLCISGPVCFAHNQGLIIRTYDNAQGTGYLNPISTLINTAQSGSTTLSGSLYYPSWTEFSALPGFTSEETFSVLWTGVIAIAASGTHTFGTKSDDGSVLYLDRNNDGDFLDSGELVVNNNRDQGASSSSASVTLDAGQYRMVIGFYENGGGQYMEARWRYGEWTYSSLALLNSTSGVLFTDFHLLVDNQTPATNVTTVSGGATCFVYDAPVSSATRLVLYWGTTDGGTSAESWQNNVQVTADAGTGTHTYNLTSLAAGTKYYYRFYVDNGSDTAWASVTASFTTLPRAPFIANICATNQSGNEVTVLGNVISTGVAPTTVYLYYGTSDGGSNRPAWASSVNAGLAQSNGQVSVNLSGLAASTLYYCRYYATNSYGEDWADTSLSFSTLASYPMVSVYGSATGVTLSSACVNGSLVSTGSAATAVFVYWGTADGGTNRSAWQYSGSLGIKPRGFLTTSLTGLTPYSLYYYTFYASNSFGGAWAEKYGSFVTVNPFSPPAGTADARQLLPSSKRHALIISEIMYNSPAQASYANLQFVEIYNTDWIPYDIGGFQLAGDVDYEFPVGTWIPARSYFVVAAEPEIAGVFYGMTNVFGPFDGGLPNGGGTVRMEDRNGAVLLEVKYSDDYPWPISPDGAGHSLVLAKPDYGEGDRRAWAPSAAIYGNPGTGNAVLTNALTKVVINEFLAHTDPPQLDFIELFNTGSSQVNISGCYLTDDPSTNKYRIANGTTLAGRGYVSFTETQLGFLLDPGGEEIFLIRDMHLTHDGTTCCSGQVWLRTTRRR